MKNLKRSISFVLALLLALSMAFSVSAAEAVPGGFDAAASQLRAGMVSRQPDIKVSFSLDRQPVKEDLGDIMILALAHTGNPKEGDYLVNHTEKYTANALFAQVGNQFRADVTYHMNYYTNAEQEQIVGNKINELLASWNLNNATEYEKIAKIYNFITTTVQYDFANLKNDAYKLKYSAYAALIDQTAVCQGYAGLFYRLALSLGIDCRVITGQSRGENHAWNIVKLGGRYYYLDATWDRGATTYRYFLKGTSTFSDHLSDSPYTTPEFLSVYPISATDYDPNNPPAPLLPVISFRDVKAGAYYEKGVLWAVEKGITKGTSATTFSPDKTCSRGEIVTFLWRANGSPEPQSTANPFTDVKAGAYYSKAVLWAVEKGITAGTAPDKFSPNADCTREQIVTFLWRSQGKPVMGSTNPFKDVTSGTYYYNAVLWAVERNITKGTSATTFAPKADCTRGQIVTFLYRSMA